jgi:hypothetical protein
MSSEAERIEMYKRLIGRDAISAWRLSARRRWPRSSEVLVRDRVKSRQSSQVR